MFDISLQNKIFLPLFGSGRFGVFHEEKWPGLLGVNLSMSIYLVDINEPDCSNLGDEDSGICMRIQEQNIQH